MQKPKLSIFLSHLDHVLEGHNARLIDIAKTIEQAGADQVVLSEHIALASVIAGEGEAAIFPFPSDENYPEPLVTLAAIGAATSRLELATGILIAPLRPAIVLAKMVATLDQFCNGRLQLGLGSGWHVPELNAAGVEHADRLSILEETLRACRVLWAEGPSSFSGEHVAFENLHCVPKPLSGAGLPVWLAGPPTAKAIDRVARLAQGWLPLGNVSSAELARGRDHLRAAEVRYGLDEGALGIRTSLPAASGPSLDDRLDATFSAAPALLAAGATQLQFPLWQFIHSEDDVGPVVAGACERIAAL